MKLGIRRALLLGLAVPAVFVVQAVPAGATLNINAVAVVVQGGGTITPGIHLLPTGKQFFTFTSVNITSVGTVHKATTVAGTSQCLANGQSGLINPLTKGKITVITVEGTNVPPDDTLAFGTGLGTWTCFAGPLAGKSGLLYYTRVGPVVSVVLTNATKPIPTGFGHLTCLFLGNETPPALVQSYGLTCVGAYIDQL